MYILKILVERNIYALKDYLYYASDKEVKRGTRVVVTLKNKELMGFVIDSFFKDATLKECVEEYGFDIFYIKEVIDEEPIINEELFSLATKLSKNLFYPLIGVFQLMLPKSLKPLNLNSKNKPKISYDYFYEYVPNQNVELTRFEKKILSKFTIFPKIEKNKLGKSKSLDSLIEKGIIKLVKEEKYRYNINQVFDYEKDIKLTSEQENVYNEILNSEDKVFLLKGVTGSGKTEVYIKLIERYLNEGKNALILVPEIALTPLMISRIKSYFDVEIAILHSSLTDGEKYDEYRKIRDNKVRIVIGTRSAIFAPLTNIGIICIDEEDSESYKEESTLSYNAKDVAILRSEYYNAKVILGSATPSIESMSKAKTNRYHLVTILNRYNQNELPLVELVDNTNYLNYSSKSSIFSLPLIKAIKEALIKDEQVILLINKRGYSSGIMCRECGYTYKCPTCGITLRYHKEDNTLRCHHCNYKIKKPSKCPECGSTNFTNIGFGIEKVEEDFKKIFNVPYLVLDGDRTSKTLQISTILQKFNNKEANVLIGTQIVSKGHDFSDVTLTAILDTDGLFSYPSYKTNEHAYNLIVQTIGRGGRKDKKGKTIIQTSSLNNKILLAAINDDYESFYNLEMTNRKIFKNPPFFNVLSIKIYSKKYDLIDNYANDIYSYLKVLNLPILINNFTYKTKEGIYYTRRLFIKYKSVNDIYSAINNLIDVFKNKPNLIIKINVNPYDY